MSSVADSSIYYGDEIQLPVFPAITVELVSSNEEWKSFPSNKDSVSNIVIRAFDQSLTYMEGLRSVENLANNISDTLQANKNISGIVYNYNILSKRFSPGMYDNIPVFGCEIELEVKQRFGVSV